MKSILEMNSFEENGVIIKWFLQYEQLKKHTVTIGIDQPLSSTVFYEHRCMENTKKNAGKCDNKYK